MAKQAAVVLGILIIFGILVPFWKGIDFLDPLMLTAYMSISLLFVGPASAEAFAGPEKPASRSELFQRAGTVLAYGWGVTVLIIFAGIATVNVNQWHGKPLTPSARFLIAILLLGLTASAAVVGIAALLARTRSSKSIKAILRTGFLVVLIVVGFGNRLLPQQQRYAIADHLTTSGITDFAYAASAVVALAAAGLFAALLK